MADLKRVGNYEILGRIGRGGMGAVFRARQINMDRVIALKILPPSLAKQPTFIDRFMREARASAKLNHPNIVNGIDVGQQGGLYYFAMEYIEGSSLKSVIDKEERLPEERAVEITREIALALEHAHTHGILHRDIKPDNILIDKNGTAKLCDLGLAHLATESEDEKSLTQSGRAVGTPHYISPEQARGAADLDATTDLYSLGATLYHMVTGVTVFQGATAVVIMTKHLSEKPVHPGDFGADLSEGVLKVLAKLLQKNRTDRYTSARKLADDLERLLQHKEPKFAELSADKWPFKGKPQQKESGPAAASRNAIVPGSALEKSSHNLRVPGRRPTRMGVSEGGVPVAAFIGMGVVLAGVLVFLLTASDSDPKVKSAAGSSKNSTVAAAETHREGAAVPEASRPIATRKNTSDTPAAPKSSESTLPQHEELAPKSTTATMEALSNIPKSRVMGDSSVDAPPSIETPALLHPSIQKSLSDARVLLNNKEFKATLKKLEQIRGDFAGSSDLSEQAAELARIEKSAKDGDAGIQIAAIPPTQAPVPPVAPPPVDVKVADTKPAKPDVLKAVEPPKVVAVAKPKTINLMDRVQRSDNDGGNNSGANAFSAKKNDLYYVGGRNGAVDFLYQPPEEYDYKIVFKFDLQSAVQNGGGSGKKSNAPYGFAMMYVPVGGKSLVCYLPFGTSGQYAFDYINRARYTESSNPTRREYARMKIDTEYTAVLQVRKDLITLTLDGEKVTLCRRDGTNPTSDAEVKLDDAKNLGIGAVNRINLHVMEATVTELSAPPEVANKK